MNVEVEISQTAEGRKYSFNGVPEEIWNSFTERAKELRPDVENPALAWAALLGDFIDSIANVDKKVIMLRDVPSKEFALFAQRCQEARTDITSLLSELIQSAAVDRLYLARYAVKREEKIVRGRNVLLLSGITDSAMKPFIELYKKYKVSIPQLFAEFFSQIEQGKIEFAVWRKDEAGNKHDINLAEVLDTDSE